MKAEAVYKICLTRAARYADTAGSQSENLASLIAPMCYPQFDALEKLTTARLGPHRRRLYLRGSDQQQIEMARAAIRNERDQSALQTAR